MSITVCWPGKTNPTFLQVGINEYLNRISNYEKIIIKEFKECKGIQSPRLQILAEEKLINEYLLKTKQKVILLDDKGQSFTSMEFASWLNKRKFLHGHKLCFVIGGAYGFSEEMKSKADELLSLSKMTFNHQVIRLFFFEQLYRAFSIINNSPYHHE